MQAERPNTGSREGRRGGRQSLIAGVDVGSSKIACLIARVEGTGADGLPLATVAGVGHQASRGVRAGAIADLEAAEGAIRAAVEQAERMADVTLSRVSIALNCGQPISHPVSVDVSIAGHEITDQDLRQAVRSARQRLAADGADLVYSAPVNYAIDGESGIRDPRGMYGERLSVHMHVVTAHPSPVRNLELCVERCHLEVQDKTLAALAGGLACAVPDERDLGCVVVDLGGGQTTAAIFSRGVLVHTVSIPFGGHHITTDIASGLSTTVAQAERLKTLHGSAIAGAHDDRETIKLQRVGEDDRQGAVTVPRRELTGIIRPRAEEILEIVRDKLRASGVESAAGRTLIITGGGAHLNGMRELAHRVLGRHTRLGRPLRLSGLPETCAGGAFSVAAGLILRAAGDAAATPIEEAAKSEGAAQPHPLKKLAGLGRWLKSRL
jgi:cell division protein FtsA